PFLFDKQKIDIKLQQKLRSITHVVQCIRPDHDGDPLVNSMHGDFRKFMPNLQWIGYISTTSVYGNRQGQWVTENTPLYPISCNALRRFEAEQKWLSIGKELHIKVAILRLAGIYGPQRNSFIKIREKKAVRLIKKDQVFNRIRVEDIANCVIFLITNNLKGIFNICDDDPSPPQDVLTETAFLMNENPPPKQSFEKDNSLAKRLFYSDNKRVSNTKIKSLGFQLLYPNYRMSLRQLWEDNDYI
ncbi:NAD-dependent epimerase/dehydratase family protein, partial [Candidatus Liberibacter sp.]|uniref:NAD-dependent epimerase/dehydratase family protein n=1 Tax=Candidatus Liberibacter sp. TaxID=34022 RepID=UPI0015F40D3B